MRRLLIGDKKLRVRDEGEGKKAPVVLIHDAGGSSVAWIDVLKRLASRRRVIAPDLPGHGQSDPWHAASSEVSIDLYRDAIGTICARLAVDRAVLVGHGMGGAIALACALAFPDRVAALVLVGCGARMKTLPALLTALADEKSDPAELIARRIYSPSTSRAITDRWRALNLQAPREIVIADYRACDRIDLRAALPSIKTPALAVAGSDDIVLPPQLSLKLAAGLGNARAVILPHAGHMLFHEQPDRFHEALDPFLAEVT